jgi:hypothetical protein
VKWVANVVLIYVKGAVAGERPVDGARGMAGLPAEFEETALVGIT